ncbi:MAG: putative porin [Candidatus Omnitrophica bacterium]|nr:putative porin [Candidatus Omnitrophota bacterium]
MRKNLLIILVAAVCMFTNTIPTFAASTEVDSLVEKLVEKGVLTKAEGRELKSEIAADEKLMKEENLKVALPEWVQKMKVKGDYRLRYQYEKKAANAESRSRGRMRFRLGVETDIVKDKVKVGAGLATGGTDPRSTNETFENAFEHGGITWDYAYAEYLPNSYVKMIGGKFVKSSYLWAPSDMLWDSDINPEGASVHLEKELVAKIKGYMNTGVWIIDENNLGDATDPFMHYLQPGVLWKNDTFDIQVAAVAYKFNGVQGADLDNDRATNTRTGGVLKYDYDSVGGSFEAGISRPAESEFPIERVGILGEYNNNISKFNDGETDDNDAWTLGMVFGDKKVSNRGKWQFKYLYTRLEKDSFPDSFPDSDRHAGDTDVSAHEAILSLGITKNVTFGIDYYDSRRIKAASDPERLVQADLEFKF